MEKILHNTDNLNHLIGCTLTYGHFSSIHPGHIRYLNYAKKKGNLLVVALLGDKDFNQNQYQFKQEERAKSLEMIQIINNIVCLKNNEIKKLVEIIKPSFLILGTEYKNSTNQEINEAIKIQCESNRGVEFHAGDINYASTELLNNSEFDLVNQRKIQFLSACKKQNISKENILESINEWKDKNILVIGDAILDQYTACEPLGISAEAPVVVVKELDVKKFIGGAAIVASHISALGCKCNFLSVVGNDLNGEIMRKYLSKYNIDEDLIKDGSRPTTFKKRYLVENQKLFRVSKLDDRPVSEKIENQLIHKIEKLAPTSNCIVISDFVYGVITKKIIRRVIDISQKYSIPIIGDIQCSSQIGSLMKFSNFSLLCPNEREARIALQDNHSGIEIISNKLIKQLNINGLIMKLGADGFISYEKSERGKIIRQAFPALTPNPLDVAGAGDSLISTMAVGLACKHKLVLTSSIGCCMASLSVSNMGNIPIQQDVLIKYLNKLFE